MEVHAHTHTERKKWTHYLWEFLMLFLAVFCGFLAENQREHLVEHNREKQYISSLIQDVQKDTSNINYLIKQYESLQTNCDSVLENFSDAQKFSDVWRRNFFEILHGYPDFIYTDQTMQQLKNAGGLRLIRNKPVIDSIVAYDAAVRDILIEETVNDGYFAHLTDFANDQLSYHRTMNVAKESTSKETDYWINYDPKEMERLYNLIYKYRDEITDFILYLGNLKRQGANMILFLNNEY